MASYLDDVPLAYAVPSLLLPIMVTFVAYGTGARRLQRSLARLRAVGIRPVDASVAVTLAFAYWLVAASIAGSLLGVAVGSLGRWVAQFGATRPLAPASPEAIAGAAGRAVLLVILSAAAVVAFTIRAGQGGPRLARFFESRSGSGREPNRWRRSAALLGLLVLVGQGLTTTSLDAAMGLVLTASAVALLAVPDLYYRALRLPSERTLKQRLAARQLRADPLRGQAAVGVLALVVGVSFSMLVLLESLSVSDTNSRISASAPGQVNVASGTGDLNSPPDPALVRLVTGTLSTASSQPIRVGYLIDRDHVARVAGNNSGIILVAESADDVRRLSNGTLSDADAMFLRNGGLLLWEGSTRPQQTLEVTAPADPGPARTVGPLQVARADFPASWKRKAAGIVLRDTAASLALPVSTTEAVFTDVSAAQAASVKAAALRTGYDLRQVSAYAPPKPVVAPLAFWAAAIGLALLLLAVVAAVCQAQAKTLRAYLGGLVALGVNTSWARGILLRQALFLIGLSVVTGCAIAAPSLLVATTRIPGVDIFWPGRELGGLLALLLAAAAGSTWLASRGLRAGDP